MSEDLFDELEDVTTDASGGDYADWWEPESEGEALVGVIVELHSAPQDWTDPGEVPDTIYTVLSLGRGDQDEGVPYTPKQHTQLKRGLESRNAEIGDLVNLRFTGFQKTDGPGGRMMTYDIGVVKEESWRAMDGSDEVQAVLDAYAGIEGDNRREEPYGTSGGSSGGSSGGGSVEADSSELGQAASALRELVDIQQGSVGVDTAENIVTEVRGYDVDIEEAAAMAGLTLEDGTISF